MFCQRRATYDVLSYIELTLIIKDIIFSNKQWSKNEQISCEYYTDGLPRSQHGETHNWKINKRMGYEQCECMLTDEYDGTMLCESGSGQRRIEKTA